MLEEHFPYYNLFQNNNIMYNIICTDVYILQTFCSGFVHKYSFQYKGYLELRVCSNSGDQCMKQNVSYLVLKNATHADLNEIFISVFADFSVMLKIMFLGS